MKISRFLFLRRNRLLSLIFLVGLTLTMLIGNVGAGVYLSSRDAAKSIRQSYLSIGIENTLRLEAEPEMMPSGIEIDGEEGYYFEEIEWAYPFYGEVAKLSYVQTIAQRKAAAAWSKGLISLTSGTLDPLDYEATLDSPNNLCFLRIKCLEVIPDKRIGEMTMFDDGVGNTYYRLDYTLRAEVVSSLLLHPSYDAPARLEVDGCYVTADNQIPFEIGEEYYIWGSYYAPPVTYDLDKAKKLPGAMPEVWLGAWHTFSSDHVELDGESWVIMQHTEEYPVYVDCAAENAPEVLERIMEIVEKNVHLLPVIALDTTDTMFLFHQKRAQIVEGRGISAEDNAQQARVCLVSETFAALNGISVGDTIPLAFYDPGVEKVPYYDMSVWTLYPVLEDAPPLEQGEFEVVGLYSSLWQPSDYSFSLNTVFVPYSSLSGEYFQDLPILRTIVFDTGSEEAFLADLQEMGAGDSILLFDQDYYRIAASVKTTERDAAFLLLGSVIVWLALSTALLYLLMRKQRMDLRIERMLGTPARAVLIEVMSSVLVLLLLAACLAVAGSAIVTDWVAGKVLMANLGQDTLARAAADTGGWMARSGGLLLFGAAQLVAAFLVAMLLGWALIQKRALIQRYGE